MTEKTVIEKKAGSKFSGLLAAVQDRQESSDQEDATEDILVEQAVHREYTENTQKREDRPEIVKRGRPRGKRSSDEFVQVTAYIGRDTHLRVKMALLSGGDGREFSELVEDLLTKWLQSG